MESIDRPRGDVEDSTAAIRPRPGKGGPGHPSPPRGAPTERGIAELETVLGTGLALLEQGLWIIAIRAKGEEIPGKPDPATGKEPIGKGWGAERWTPQRLRTELQRRKGRGIGAGLGPRGGRTDFGSSTSKATARRRMPPAPRCSAGSWSIRWAGPRRAEATGSSPSTRSGCSRSWRSSRGARRPASPASITCLNSRAWSCGSVGSRPTARSSSSRASSRRRRGPTASPASGTASRRSPRHRTRSTPRWSGWPPRPSRTPSGRGRPSPRRTGPRLGFRRPSGKRPRGSKPSNPASGGTRTGMKPTPWPGISTTGSATPSRSSSRR